MKIILKSFHSDQSISFTETLQCSWLLQISGLYIFFRFFIRFKENNFLYLLDDNNMTSHSYCTSGHSSCRLV